MPKPGAPLKISELAQHGLESLDEGDLPNVKADLTEIRDRAKDYESMG